nr:hypothetical protein [uncultured Lachnoanaerobaculum sp.]
MRKYLAHEHHSVFEGLITLGRLEYRGCFRGLH